MEIATVGGGCFWCTEAIIKRLKGVLKVSSGYAGGTMDNPSYEAVSEGTSGHAEAVQVEFDPAILPYEKLLEIFFRFHDPTTPNRQGADVGTQYRSIIFYHSGTQKITAEEIIKKMEGAKLYKGPFVTELVPYKNFFTADEYHQNFYAKNPSYPYCQLVIDPKVEKLLEEYREYLKNV